VSAVIPIGGAMSAVAIASMSGGCAGTSGACGGDCDGSGDVTVDEIIGMGNIALGIHRYSNEFKATAVKLSTLPGVERCGPVRRSHHLEAA